MTYIVKFPWYSISKKELLLGPLLTKCGYFVKQTPEMVPDDYNFNIVMSRGQPFSVIYIHIAAIISSFYVHATTLLITSLSWVAFRPCIGWTFNKNVVGYSPDFQVMLHRMLCNKKSKRGQVHWLFTNGRQMKNIRLQSFSDNFNVWYNLLLWDIFLTWRERRKHYTVFPKNVW